MIKKNDDMVSRLRARPYFWLGTHMELFFDERQFSSHPLFFLKRKSDPIFFSLNFSHPLNHAILYYNFSNPYYEGKEKISDSRIFDFFPDPLSIDQKNFRPTLEGKNDRKFSYADYR